jgi:thiamine-phosphate pyrophosphorylase
MAMNAPRLLVILDYDFVADEEHWLGALGEVGRAMDGRPGAIQIRARSVEGGGLRPLAERAREAVPADTPLSLNGPADLAGELDYTGVHWRQDAIPDGPTCHDLETSAAVHDEESLRRAEQAAAGFVVFGSVFNPGSKMGRGVGLEALANLTAKSTVPTLAVGGIGLDRVGECIAAGAHGVAVISGVLANPCPAKAAVAYLDRLEEVCG